MSFSAASTLACRVLMAEVPVIGVATLMLTVCR